MSITAAIHALLQAMAGLPSGIKKQLVCKFSVNVLRNTFQITNHICCFCTKQQAKIKQTSYENQIMNTKICQNLLAMVKSLWKKFDKCMEEKSITVKSHFQLKSEAACFSLESKSRKEQQASHTACLFNQLLGTTRYYQIVFRLLLYSLFHIGVFLKIILGVHCWKT